MRSIAVIYQDRDADSTFGVQFPGLPGCFSAGDTFEEAEANAREALDLYFEDGDRPTPRTMHELHASGELSEHVAAGAMLVPILSNPRA